MALELHFVAFIDILGFAEMVRSDCESPAEQGAHFTRLEEVHNATRERFDAADECRLVQFSDSVVLSRPYDLGSFPSFLNLVAAFQRDLVVRKLLCRGGVSYGKHHSDGSFMFSQGMISAYRLEQQARYPRIVVSRDLLELLVPNHLAAKDLPLLRADDGYCFVNYVDEASLAPAAEAAQSLLADSQDPSVRDKALWLARYLEYVKGDEGIAPASFEPLG